MGSAPADVANHRLKTPKKKIFHEVPKSKTHICHMPSASLNPRT